ncbi:hypothetical protein JZ751_004550 [Albula glossodonta]|uniref:GYF domain-containing protein n=1 Tax=Albula glossodonta TaxID=121402 RepID=A0A8T2N5H5_9TELE|nr:hypothetical protein JZ751_004550 [Albula glossodonta]
MSVNSVAVLRLMGKGGGALPAGVARGRGSTRGGRGGFYQREEGEGGFGRSSREIHRSQSWDDRGERRFEKPGRREGVRVGFEEAGPGGHGGPRSAGWRRKFEFDFREHGEGGRRRAGSDGLEDERDGLPEWCTDEEDGEMGTFDSSGAFLPIKKGNKDSVAEELEFQGLEEEEEEQERKETNKERDVKDGAVVVCEGEANAVPPSSPPALSAPSSDPQPAPSDPEAPPNPTPDPTPQPAKASKLPSEVGAPQLNPAAPLTLTPSPPLSSAATQLPPPGGDPEDDEGMKHLQQEECFSQVLQESRNTAAALPLSHEAAMKWFYKDPQGEIQGPFTTLEMSEWFQAGYFTMTLLVKRGCDEGFQPLGDVIKMWGRVPFAPGPSPPPLLVSQPPPQLLSRGPTCCHLFMLVYLQGNMEQDRLKKQQEFAALYQQLQQQQLFQLINRYSSPVTGGEASLWDLTMNSSTQGPTLEQLQKLQERRDAELRAKREEEERKRREEKRRQQEEQKRREEEELFRRKQCRQQQELIMKLLQQSQQQQATPTSGWNPAQMPKSSKTPLTLLELQQQQQHRAQHRDRHGSLGGQWSEGVGGVWGGGGVEGKGGGAGMGLWDEAGLKPQDGFTTWCEQMLHALNTSANNNSSSSDVATIVAYLKEVESPYEVHDFIRSYLGDTVEAKEFAKQFLERRAKQKANHQRQQQQLSKEVAGLTMNFPLQDSMRGLSPSALQAMFHTAHVGKGGTYDSQSGKMKKKQSMMLHSDPSILGYSFHGAADRLSLSEMEAAEEY